MPRRTKAELETAYADKLALFEVLWKWKKHFLKISLPHEIDPVQVAIRNREKFPISQALSGMQQAINDTLEIAIDAGPAEILDLNKRLAAAGQPSFMELSAQSAKKIQGALHSGKIKTIEEYYLIIGLLGDVENGLLPEQLAAFNAMIGEYEARASQ